GRTQITPYIYWNDGKVGTIPEARPVTSGGPAGPRQKLSKGPCVGRASCTCRFSPPGPGGDSRRCRRDPGQRGAPPPALKRAPPGGGRPPRPTPPPPGAV